MTNKTPTPEELERFEVVSTMFAVRINEATEKFVGQLNTPQLQADMTAVCSDIVDEFVADGHFSYDVGLSIWQALISMVGESCE